MGKIIVTSGGYLDGQRGENLDSLISDTCKGKKVLILSNATITGSNVKGVPNIKTNFEKLGCVVDVVCLTDDNVEQIHECDVVYITGGDMAPLGEMVTPKTKENLLKFLSNGGTVIGESAGSIILGEDFKWYYDVKKGTKPKYDIELPSYKGFGLVSFNIYPHWNKAKEDQKSRVREYSKEHNIDIIEMLDGEWIEEIFLNNNINLI